MRSGISAGVKRLDPSKISSPIDQHAQFRLHGIDFCRAIFMLLGLFFHAGLIYSPEQSWRVGSSETSLLISSISDFIHSFRMEAFYFISGFFYLLVYSKKQDGFIKDRVFRALIPLLFCGIFINPIMNFLSYNNTYDWNLKYIMEGQWLGHLWFLGNLIVYFSITKSIAPFIANSKKLSSPVIIFLFYILIPLFSIACLALKKLTTDITFIFISFDGLLYFYSYFLLGCICYRNKNAFLSILTGKVLLLSAFTFAALSLPKFLNIIDNELTIKIIDKLSTGSLVLSIIAITYIIGSKSSNTIRKISDASYTIYILHQPLIIILYAVFFEYVEWGAIPEYAMLIIMVYTISYYFHRHVIKNNNFLRLLFNGVIYSKNGTSPPPENKKN
jgi:glucan biosynthesis protein C